MLQTQVLNYFESNECHHEWLEFIGNTSILDIVTPKSTLMMILRSGQPISQAIVKQLTEIGRKEIMPYQLELGYKTAFLDKPNESEIEKAKVLAEGLRELKKQLEIVRAKEASVFGSDFKIESYNISRLQIEVSKMIGDDVGIIKSILEVVESLDDDRKRNEDEIIYLLESAKEIVKAEMDQDLKNKLRETHFEYSGAYDDNESGFSCRYYINLIHYFSMEVHGNQSPEMFEKVKPILADLQRLADKILSSDHKYPDELEVQMRTLLGVYRMRLENYNSAMDEFQIGIKVSEKIEKAQGEKSHYTYDLQFFKCVLLKQLNKYD